MNGLKKINIGVYGSSGRMGRAIVDELNISKEYNLQYSYDGKSENSLDELLKCDVIIDFSTPKATLDLIRAVKHHKVKIVSGTTGFTDLEFSELINLSKSIPILYSANMSIGINIINYLLKILDQNLPNDFDIDIIDMHHSEKKDRPSGTALMLQNSIKSRISNIASIRSGQIIGTHELYFSGLDEQIVIKHNVFSRKVFASGALKAAMFLHECNNPRLYSMKDIFYNSQ
jgi:4-hydroxy-tetrahydrodipicolinate reductase